MIQKNRSRDTRSPRRAAGLLGPSRTTGASVGVALALLSGACGEAGFPPRGAETGAGPAERVATELRHLDDRDLRALAERFRRTLEGLVNEDGLPGAVAAYALPSGRVGVVAAGFADRERGVRMAPHSRLLAGSVGKTFVAAVALALVQDGTLTLDEPVARYLGDEPWFGRVSNGSEMTIRHLLTHSSGLPDHVYDEDFSRAVAEALVRGDPDRVFSPRDLVSFVLNDPPLFSPGEGYAYTDTGYVLAGLVIEKVTGRSYFEELADRFLVPLRLQQTGAAARTAPYLAAGYLAENNRFGLPSKIVENGVMLVDPSVEYTGGGLVSNAGDLARWGHALYEEDALPTPYLDELIGSAVSTGSDGGSYGLGVRIADTPLGRTYGHSGWFPGYSTLLAHYPAYGITVTFQTNTDQEVRLGAYRDTLAAVVLRDLGLLDEPR